MKHKPKQIPHTDNDAEFENFVNVTRKLLQIPKHEVTSKSSNNKQKVQRKITRNKTTKDSR